MTMIGAYRTMVGETELVADIGLLIYPGCAWAAIIPDWWMVEGVSLTLVPPKNQAAANDAAHDSGAGPADTLAAQDKADAEKEAKRLIAKGKAAAKKPVKKAA